MTDVRGLWTPLVLNPFQGNPLDEVVKAYADYISVCAPEQHRLFQDRARRDRDAARAEAAVFSWLRAQKLSPEINEVPGREAADFLCSPPQGGSILLEVTSLNAISVSNKSSIPNNLAEVAGRFSMITPQLMRKADSKVRQLSAGQPGIPGIAVVCLVHPAASVLLGTLAAHWMMVSDSMIRVPLASFGDSVRVQTTTDLQYSIFLEWQNGVITPVRTSISAVLLVSLWDKHLEIVGLLHPEPAIPLDYRLFPRVPFLRLDWPIANAVQMDWVIGAPAPFSADHHAVVLSNEELRGV
jgi:hypothetical protein